MFHEESREQRGAQLVAWYSEQVDQTVELVAEEATVNVVADVLAYAEAEGERAVDVANAAVASLMVEAHERKEHDEEDPR